MLAHQSFSCYKKQEHTYVGCKLQLFADVEKAQEFRYTICNVKTWHLSTAVLQKTSRLASHNDGLPGPVVSSFSSVGQVEFVLFFSL